MKTRIIVGICISFVALLLVFYTNNGNGIKNTNTNINLSSQTNIVIDAGHGGFDGGAVAYDKSSEKDINLQIALKLKDIFLSGGFNVIMTREQDISTDDSESTKKSKKRDMYKRLDILNESDNNVFISIHQNKFSDPKCKGTQVFYGGNNKNSEILAKSIQDNFKNELQPNNNRVEVKAKKGLFLLYKAKVPAVLIECGFISNKDELMKLKEEEYQSKVAMTIFKGFMDYFVNV